MSLPFLYAPDLSGGVPVSFRHQTGVERQKKGGEVRTSYAPEMLREWSFSYLLEGRKAQEAREFFENLTPEFLRFPDWSCPANVKSVSGSTLQLSCFERLDFRCHSIFLIRNFEDEGMELDISGYNPDTGSLTLSEPLDLETPSCYLVYPVRVGELDKIPSFGEFGDDKATFKIKLSEQFESINSNIVKAAPPTRQEFLGAPAVDLFRKDGEEQWEQSFSFEKKGFGISTPYQREDESKRRLSFSIYQAGREEVYDIIDLFDEMRGRARGLWISSDRCNYRLRDDADAGQTQLFLEGDDLARLASQRVGYQHLCLRCGLDSVFVEVASVTGSGDSSVVTLAAPLPQDFHAYRTAISLLSFVRFASDELKLSFATDQHAKGSLSFIELPDEYQIQSQEYRPAFLYEFTGFFTERVTSYGVNIVSQGETFTPGNINHGAISSKAESLKSSCSVSYIPGASHPLDAFRQGYPVEPIEATIYEVDADSPSVRTILYRGKVRTLDFGKKGEVSLKLGSPADVAESEIPTAYIEPRCPRLFLNSGCNLSASAYQLQATVSAVTGAQVVVPQAQTESTTRGFSDWFANGSIRIGTELRSIIKQDGQILTVSTPFVNAAPGNVATLLPGCNRTQKHCKDRFNNFENFGGAPLVPPDNPQLEAVRFNSTPSGGKK